MENVLLIIFSKKDNKKDYVLFDDKISIEDFALLIMKRDNITEFKLESKINKVKIYVKIQSKGMIYNSIYSELLYEIEKVNLTEEEVFTNINFKG